MVQIAIHGSEAIFRVQGLHKLWAFRAGFRIPLGHIQDVRAADPQDLREWWKGIRLPGTHIPGFLVAGTFFKNGRRYFWDVGRDPKRVIVVELTDEPYAQLIIEVGDPVAEVARFQAAPLS